MREACNLTIKGTVQGVGFRPFVYRCAHELGVTGWVYNCSTGVVVHAEAEPEVLNSFIMMVHDTAPAAAHIAEIAIDEAPMESCDSFQIVASKEGGEGKTTQVSADLALCDECRRELFDPQDRRFRYPFINCTNCGPRFTVIDSLPYDRPRTSMADFCMCPDCEEEYANPADRRFHAQPDACFDCGPSLFLTEATEGEQGKGDWPITWGYGRKASDELITRTVQLLQEGAIVAVKGLGGFHLVCDAQNEQAVATLRERKRREGKPFAVMMNNLETVRRFCLVSEEEARVLQGVQHPIVLLKKRPDAQFVPGLADGLYELGVMLPYTPVQALIMHDFAEDGGAMLVMTSGNVHDEPIVIDDEKALQQLGDIADAILGNNRAILARYDDSVVRVLDFGQLGSAQQFVRRARGYAPSPITLAAGFEAPAGQTVCATGPEQKTTACFVRGNDAFVTQHVGDMENALVNDAWYETLERYQSLFDMQPSLLACDKHPEYLTTKWARQQALPRVEVQHHHAHIVSALAENGINEAALGFAFDGTGYGADGAIWGGEALLCNLTAFERFANFAYVPMPGGAACVKHPLRMAYGVLWANDLLEHPAAVAALAPLGTMTQLLDQMIEGEINTPYTSSVGRLFDSASALLGICPEPTYESEGAVQLEAAAVRAVTAGANDQAFDSRYTISIEKNIATETSTAQDTSVLLFDAAPTFQALLDDLQAGVCPDEIALCFHNAFVEAMVTAAQIFRALYDISLVALSGGVFLNRYLMEHVVPLLAAEGFNVALNREVPPSDGCISLGQAVVACATAKQAAAADAGSPETADNQGEMPSYNE